MNACTLTTNLTAKVIRENIATYSLLPLDADLGFRLELFDFSAPIPAHYHRKQKQVMMVIEGSVMVTLGDAQMTLNPQEIATVEPGVLHTIAPKGRAELLILDLPGFEFPEDVYWGVPHSAPIWAAWGLTEVPKSALPFFSQVVDCGSYKAYEIVTSEMTQSRWSVALLQITDSPRHVHRIEKEHFIVLSGELVIEVDGFHRTIKEGEAISLLPGMIHQLRSAETEPVFVLCISFPAFDPSDMHLISQKEETLSTCN